MRSVQPCSAATWTAVRPSSERAQDGQPSASSRRTASARFHAAAQYSGVHPSRSFTSGGDPCTIVTPVRSKQHRAVHDLL